MLATIFHKGKEYRVDFFKPIDISIPLSTDKHCVSAWYVNPMKIEPVVMGDWIGDVNLGGTVNFRNITFNPHGNGTHTECVGHISREFYTINQCLKQFFFIAELITVLPEEIDGDFIITKKCIEPFLKDRNIEALIIRTLSNPASKIHNQYSNTNPPFISKEAMEFIVSIGVDHLLFDMPSVDKEVDDGELAAHHVFWNYPEKTQFHKSITEMIFVPNSVLDGTFFLNIQIASFENDASPSKPVLYDIVSMK
ncbi:MAG: cyclase family protein [Bacteroidia bacterium]|nr:cyclase family protein [Bacteroidia bacterium]